MRIQGGSVDLCGTTTTAQTFFSSDEEIVVRFMSDASINRGGFYFRIQGKLQTYCEIPIGWYAQPLMLLVLMLLVLIILVLVLLVLVLLALMG